MKSLIVGLCMIVFATQIFGQVDFYDATEEVMGEERLTSTVCIGFNDLDGDWMDDLILLDNGNRLKTFIQGAPSKSFEYEDHGLVSQVGDWALVSGDLDNDGIPEIVISGNSNGSKFMKWDGEGYTKAFEKADVYSQNTNLVDINEDGYLDFFVCNDDGESLFFLNDGNGGMVESKVIDFVFTEEQDLAGNYSSIFTDIDGDGDLDLYLGKCKAEATEETDPRRVNQLYINNGDGTFSERAKEFGLDIGKQSWSVDAGDVDNDGDMDILVANHHGPHDLMINDGNGHFDKKILVPGGYTTFAFQSFFCDFDNNGWLDILFTDPSATFILFNDEMSFSRRDIVSSGQRAFSAATGDLNFDGFPDLYLGFAVSFQDPGVIEDRVLFNQTNSNNFLTVKLIGTESNRDAVGAKVIVYQGENFQTREIVAGKSYGIMNSTVCHFGLGSSSIVDSVLVKWPSGLEMTFDDVKQVNTLYTIKENGCISPLEEMIDLTLCDDESVSPLLPFGYDSYLWSNGETTREIEVSEPGWYRGMMVKDVCTARTNYFEIKAEVDVVPSDVIQSKDRVLCEGDFVKIKAISGYTYSWSTGETTRSIDVFEPGEYSVTVAGNCDTYISNSLKIEVEEVIEPVVENDTIQIGEKAYFEGESDDLKWYQNKNDLIPIGIGSEFVTPILFENQTYFVGEETSGFGLNKSLMSIVPLNTIGDSVYTQNEQVSFEVLDDLILKSIRVRTQFAGERSVMILKGEEEVYSSLVDLSNGVNTISINYAFEPGAYVLTTDAEVNLANLGTEHPKLSYSEIYGDKDKIINGYLTINDSQSYPGVSPYFFDWDVDYGFFSCEPRVPVQAVVKDMVSTTNREFHARIYPNPSTGRIYIDSEASHMKVELFDVSGTIMIQTITTSAGRTQLHLPDQNGLYFIRLTDGISSTIQKVVKH